MILLSNRRGPKRILEARLTLIQVKGVNIIITSQIFLTSHFAMLVNIGYTAQGSWLFHVQTKHLSVFTSWCATFVTVSHALLTGVSLMMQLNWFDDRVLNLWRLRSLNHLLGADSVVRSELLYF